MSDGLTAQLSALTAAMRAEGARVGVGELLGAHRALAAVDPGHREQVRLALRVVLCSQHGDLERFERSFLRVFGLPGRRAAGEGSRLGELGEIERAALPRAAMPAEPGAPAPRAAAGEEPVTVPAAWSQIELLREKDFATLTAAEEVLARRLIRALARRGPMRPSRRHRPARRRSHIPDLRRTVRASLRSGGEPVHRAWREPGQRPRPVVLVCDVSGSMAPYARMLLTYMQACVAARRRVEAFAFGTRLTRITRELAGLDPGQALERAAAACVDFAGGTRIGDSLAELNRVHGRRLGRGAVVVILSDGWDRGDPARLGAEMARLQRTAHRLVWCNPLAARPAWAPLTRGMQAAVPHTDRLLTGNSLGALAELAQLLEDM